MNKCAQSILTGALVVLSFAVTSVWAAEPKHELSLENFADGFKDQRSCMMGVSIIHDYMSVLKSLPDKGWSNLIEESDIRVDLLVKAELIKNLSTDTILSEIGMDRSSILVLGSKIESLDDYDRINARNYNVNYWHNHFVHLNDKCALKFQEFEITQQKLDEIKDLASFGARMDIHTSWDDFSELYIDFDWTLDEHGDKVPKKQ